MNGPNPPASAKEFVGRPFECLSTPALVVDIEALDRNLELVAGFFACRRSRPRPHFKSHKCVTLARRQLEKGGASGVTCAKLSEAEVLVAGDVRDVLVANQVVGAEKARRLAELNRAALVRAAVDSAGNVAELGRAASGAGATIGVLVEVDVGMKRCGVEPGRPAVELARAVAGTKGLRFNGLQGYEGHLVSVKDPEDRKRRVAEDLGRLVRTRREIERSGLEVPIVSSGGTGTYDVAGGIEGIDEVQCGSYALMDANYRNVRPEFANALHVLATVISARAGRVVLDVGLKGMGCEFCMPLVAGRPEAEVLGVSEEHTTVGRMTAGVGEKIRLIPSHGCTTANLHRRMWIVKGGVVEDCWPIDGSGCLE